MRVKKADTKGLHSKILRICNVSHLESHANAAKNQLRTDVIKKRAMRQLLLTSLEIGELYKQYPLYYGTRLDFRLRMYPLQYLLSRTSGYLKNLLEESVQKKK
jgi:DNA-directed RNA polymerase